ncbi:uncharacterized protein LOC119377088 [Rhipicephalus sanguineus]|uniref:uncharacterized protein LOC119377088 n=1 Tax=Rhipicephalus sanguineus TaxID=34632 RepID=UPI0020C4D014|nr:uncharacterized protein LOC119377088 [Rhipicephalus sanguineus]
MGFLWREEFKPTPEGDYDEEGLKRGCSLIKGKLPCHQHLDNCSEAVTGDRRIQERGYEEMRNIVCDVNSLKESHDAIKCLSREKLEECARALMPTSNPQDAGKSPVPTPRCNLIKEKLPCHQRLANCFEAATGDHRTHESGYEEMRNIICDVNALEATHNGLQCLDMEKVEECVRALMPASNPQDAGKPPVPTLRCNKNPSEIASFDEAFNSSCILSKKTAKAAVTRAVKAATLLKGYDSFANAVVASRGFLVLLAVPVILVWWKT